MLLQEIFKKYSTEAKSKAAFKALRDEQGVVCKKCGNNTHYWKSDKDKYQCKKCEFRTGLRNGTVMEASKLPYQYWMIAMSLVTATKKSFSTMEIQRQLGHKRYEPIWLMMQKIRMSMGNRDDNYQLGGFVEIDEGFFEGQQEKEKDDDKKDKYQAYQNKGKRQVKVLVAASTQPSSKLHKNKSKPKTVVKFIKMKVLDAITKEGINYEVKKHINPQSQAITDGRRVYSDLKNILKGHQSIICEDKKEVSKLFPWVHIAISNAKKMCLGVHHSINKAYMQNYLNEFCYKFNRRYYGAKLLERLLIAAVQKPWYG